MESWISSEIIKLRNEYGDVPPHWVIFPDEHPYSICWRMGTGEQHIMVWSVWWDSQNYDESQQITYFQKWKPSPCWLGWIIEVIWNINKLRGNIVTPKLIFYSFCTGILVFTFPDRKSVV